MQEIICKVCFSLCGLYDMTWIRLLRPSQGGTCSLVPLKNIALYPCFPKTKSSFCMFPVPKNCLCSPVPLIFRPLFPCSPEKIAIVPLFPQTPGRASLLAHQNKAAKTELSEKSGFQINFNTFSIWLERSYKTTAIDDLYSISCLMSSHFVRQKELITRSWIRSLN